MVEEVGKASEEQDIGPAVEGAATGLLANKAHKGLEEAKDHLAHAATPVVHRDEIGFSVEQPHVAVKVAHEAAKTGSSLLKFAKVGGMVTGAITTVVGVATGDVTVEDIKETAKDAVDLAKSVVNDPKKAYHDAVIATANAMESVAEVSKEVMDNPKAALQSAADATVEMAKETAHKIHDHGLDNIKKFYNDTVMLAADGMEAADKAIHGKSDLQEQSAALKEGEHEAHSRVGRGKPGHNSAAIATPIAAIAGADEQTHSNAEHSRVGHGKSKHHAAPVAATAEHDEPAHSSGKANSIHLVKGDTLEKIANKLGIKDKEAFYADVMKANEHNHAVGKDKHHIRAGEDLTISEEIVKKHHIDDAHMAKAHAAVAHIKGHLDKTFGGTNVSAAHVDDHAPVMAQAGGAKTASKGENALA